MLQINREDFDKAAQKQNLSLKQTEELWVTLEKSPRAHQSLTMVNTLLYLGAALIFFAMWVVFGVSGQWFGEATIFVMSTFYALAFFIFGGFLWNKGTFKTAGGIFITLGVCALSLAVLGLRIWLSPEKNLNEGYFDHYLYYDLTTRFLMEGTAIIAGLIALRFVQFPFLIMPIALALWALCLDLEKLFFTHPMPYGDHDLMISWIFGLVMLIAAVYVDRQFKLDYAFWLYFIGALAFSIGILELFDTRPGYLNKFIYCLINLGLIILSTILDRKVLAVFGFIGVFIYLFYLAVDLFDDWRILAIIISLTGVLFIWLAIVYQRNQTKIESAILGVLPDALKKWLPRR